MPVVPSGGWGSRGARPQRALPAGVPAVSGGDTRGCGEGRVPWWGVGRCPYPIPLSALCEVLLNECSREPQQRWPVGSFNKIYIVQFLENSSLMQNI